MNQLKDIYSTSEDVLNTYRDGGHIDSTDMLLAGPSNLWDDALDALLSWKNEDHVSWECLTTAIDFSIDMKREGHPAPSCISANEDGTISFEWRYDGTTLAYEVQGLGEIEHFVLDNGRVVVNEHWYRDPVTRKLQLSAG
ncbi:MAG: hypothetical protein AAGC44_10455 [Planctomycetota bacterium]